MPRRNVVSSVCKSSPMVLFSWSSSSSKGVLGLRAVKELYEPVALQYQMSTRASGSGSHVSMSMTPMSSSMGTPGWPSVMSCRSVWLCGHQYGPWVVSSASTHVLFCSTS